MSSGPGSPRTTMPPFMPSPFLDPMITDEQHMSGPFPAFADPNGVGAVAVYDPSLEPIPNASASESHHPSGIVEDGSHDEHGQSHSEHGDGNGQAASVSSEEKGAIKRALRACSNCRKDKTRCNGERPCAGCIKKGFKQFECIDGCVYCRQIRLRCLGGQPCANCVEAGVECIQERESDRRTGPPLNRNVNVLDFSSTATTPTRMPSHSAAGDDNRPRKRPPTLAISFPATPTQLDGHSPLYGTPTTPHSIQNGQGVMIQNPDGSIVQVPLYLNPPPPTDPSQFQGGAPIKSLAGPSRVNRPTGQDRAKTACKACRHDNKKCSNSRPCDRCVQRGEKCTENEPEPGETRARTRCKACRRDNKKCKRDKDQEEGPCKYCTSIGEFCEEVPRKGRGSGSRVKVACMGCRKDKIQCEETRPCKNCLRKGIRCLERVCTVCNGTGEGDAGRCHLCRRAEENAEGDVMMANREMNMADEPQLNSHDLIYPNIAPQLQPGAHQHQLTQSSQNPTNFDQMQLAMMSNHSHSHPHPLPHPQTQRYPQLPPPLPSPGDPTQAQAYRQMMALTRHPHHSNPITAPTSAHASLNHTPIQTPTHSRPPSPRRNISSVRFDGDFQGALVQHHPGPVMHLHS